MVEEYPQVHDAAELLYGDDQTGHDIDNAGEWCAFNNLDG